MAQPFSLQTLLEVMQTRSDDATRRLGQLIAAEHDARARLNMLEQYRDEYADKMRAATQQGIPPLVLRNYQEFLGRIQEAIQQQAQAVKNSERNTAAGRNHWQEQNKRLKAIDTLSQRHEARERFEDNRRDQKILDEFTTRQFSHHRQDSSLD